MPDYPPGETFESPYTSKYDDKTDTYITSTTETRGLNSPKKVKKILCSLLAIKVDRKCRELNHMQAIPYEAHKHWNDSSYDLSLILVWVEQKNPVLKNSDNVQSPE